MCKHVAMFYILNIFLADAVSHLFSPINCLFHPLLTTDGMLTQSAHMTSSPALSPPVTLI